MKFRCSYAYIYLREHLIGQTFKRQKNCLPFKHFKKPLILDSIHQLFLKINRIAKFSHFTIYSVKPGRATRLCCCQGGNFFCLIKLYTTSQTTYLNGFNPIIFNACYSSCFQLHTENC